MRLHTRTAALLEIHLAVFLFGAAAVLAKLTSLGAAEIVLGRTFFAALTLVWPAWHAARSLASWRLRRLRCLPFLGMLLAFHWFAFFQSVITANVAVGLITFSSFPLFTVLLEPYFLAAERKRRDAIFACAILAGVALVIPRYDLGNSITLGAVWGLASGLSFAILQILNRHNAQKIPASQLSFGQNGFAFVALLAVLGPPALPLISTRDWLLLFLLGTACTALAHTLFIRGLRVVSAQTASLIAGLETVYGIVLAIFVLSEVPSLRTFVGGVIVVGTVICATRGTPAPATLAARGRLHSL